MESFYFTPKFPFLIKSTNFWLKQLGNSAPTCTISHLIKIYVSSKHNDELIQSRGTDLNSCLAVYLFKYLTWYVILGGFIKGLCRPFQEKYMTNKGSRDLLPPLHMTSTSVSHVFLPCWNGLGFFSLSSINIMQAEPSEQKGQAVKEDISHSTDKTFPQPPSTTLTFYKWLHVLHTWPLAPSI